MVLSDSRQGRRPSGDVEVATLAYDGPPPITRITLLACRAYYPGGPKQVRVLVASLSVRPSPNLRRVGVRKFTFEIREAMVATGAIAE